MQAGGGSELAVLYVNEQVLANSRMSFDLLAHVCEWTQRDAGRTFPGGIRVLPPAFARSTFVPVPFPVLVPVPVPAPCPVQSSSSMHNVRAN